MLDGPARLAENLNNVRARIAAAAVRSGRSPDDVRLVAVTKYVDTAVAWALMEIGCHDLGESRPQELWHKADELKSADSSIRWHFIGHLQRNKLARTLPYVALLHSGDSLRLLEAVDEFGRSQQRKIPTLIEVNISGDVTKHGFKPEEMPGLGEALSKLTHIDVRGLMGMSSLEGDQHDARAEFAGLRQLRDRLKHEWPASIALNELSMGMSDDFEAAIEAGATLVRIGSALFEGIA